MITEAFDDQSPALINPKINENAPTVDACIVTFSHVIERFVLENFDCRSVGIIRAATGETPVYQFEVQGKRFAFFKTYIGAPACVATVEDCMGIVRTRRYIVFGGAGCLDKAIARGKVMVPTAAYRDEGTSYHYAPASDYVAVKNAAIVAEFMQASRLPFVLGKTWTTDSIYRETANAFQKHKADGCISVEMECAALQAMCDFRGLELYMFFTGGDLLDAPEWDARMVTGCTKGTQHDAGHFDIALALAHYVASR